MNEEEYQDMIESAKDAVELIGSNEANITLEKAEIKAAKDTLDIFRIKFPSEKTITSDNYKCSWVKGKPSMYPSNDATEEEILKRVKKAHPECIIAVVDTAKLREICDKNELKELGYSFTERNALPKVTKIK